MSYERMEKRAAELEAEVERWLRSSAAEAADAEEDRAFGRDKSGEELPKKWVADKKKRARRCGAAKADWRPRRKRPRRPRPKRRPRPRGSNKPRAARNRASPPPRHIEEPDPREAQKNYADPESRIMKTKDGFIPG